MSIKYYSAMFGGVKFQNDIEHIEKEVKDMSKLISKTKQDVPDTIPGTIPPFTKNEVHFAPEGGGPKYMYFNNNAPEPEEQREEQEQIRLNQNEENELMHIISSDVMRLVNPIFHGWNPHLIYINRPKINFEPRNAPEIVKFGEYTGIVEYGRSTNNGLNALYFDIIDGVHRGPHLEFDENGKPKEDKKLKVAKRPSSASFPKATKKKPDYYTALGYKFKKELNLQMLKALDRYGYEDFLTLNPDYRYEEKPVPINKDEEVIINVNELANYYATEELKAKYEKFSIENYAKEYEEVLSKHTKKIRSFKRNDNG